MAISPGNTSKNSMNKVSRSLVKFLILYEKELVIIDNYFEKCHFRTEPLVAKPHSLVSIVNIIM